MIEMRWLERKEKFVQPFTSVYEDRDKGIECMRIVKVLQYRYCEPCSSLAEYHDDFTDWSDWLDIPTENEDD